MVVVRNPHLFTFSFRYMKRKLSNPIFQVMALVLGAVLIISAMLLAGAGREKLANQSAETRFWTFKLQAAHGFQGVVIGDSRAYRGFDPEFFHKKTGVSSINLGFSSAGFTRSLFELAERHLRRSGLRVVFLAITPHSLTEEAAKNEHLTEWTARSQLELFSSRYLEKILIYLSPAALKALSNRPERNPYRQDFYDTGFVYSDRPIKDIESGISIYKTLFKGNKVSEKRLSELLEQVAQWNEQGILVVGYRPPVDPRLKQVEDAESGWNEKEWAKRFQSVGGTWLQLADEEFETYDGSHMRGESARALTSILAEEINKLLVAPR